MAHVMKHTRAASGHMFKHYERAQDENGEYIKFGNQDIDTEVSSSNYNLAPDREISQGDFVRQRCSEVRMQNRKDVNVMCSWVVTAPQNLPNDDMDKFFGSTYDFLSDRYGKENVVSAYVHMDETTPHMHYAFVPVVEDKKRGGYKVSAKEAIDRKDLQTFHKDFDAHMTRVFGRDIGVQNEATKEGNKSIDELKLGTATERISKINRETKQLEKQVEEMSQTAAIRTQKIDELSNQLSTMQSEKTTLQEQIETLESKLEQIDHKAVIKAQKVDELSNQLDFMQNEKNTLQGQIETLESKLEQIDYKAATRAQEVDELSNQLDFMQSEKTTLQGQIEALHGDLKQRQLKIQEILEIKPEKGLMGSVKGVTVEDIEKLKVTAIKGLEARKKYKDLSVEHQKIKGLLPSMQERMQQGKDKTRLAELEKAFARLPKDIQKQLLSSITQSIQKER